MRAFEKHNPVVLFAYFLSVAGVAMFSMNPVIIALSLLGAFVLFLLRNGLRGFTSHLFFLGIFLVLALVNPIFYHNGMTVLFVLNNNPVTLEALIYGVVASAMVLSVVYWFRTFSQIMTGDKLLYLFGGISPKLSLILSMALRYVPLFSLQIKKVNQTQKALGLYKEDNPLDSIRGGTRVFSVMATWALENGIVTADSMSARGYGCGRRTFFLKYRFRKSDAALLGLILAFLSLCLVGLALGALDFSYYPKIDELIISPLSLGSYSAYTALVFLPTIIEIREGVRWKCLQRKI